MFVPCRPRNAGIRTHRRAPRGLSTVESLIVLLATLVGLAAALPALQSSRVQRQLDGHAQQLETDIHFARSLAVAQNRNLRLSFAQVGGGSCWVIHSGPAGACRCTPAGQSTCQPGSQAHRVAGLWPHSPVQARANVTSLVFDAQLGTVTPTGSVRLQHGETRAVQLVVNVMGRVRQCTPTPATVRGLPRC